MIRSTSLGLACLLLLLLTSACSKSAENSASAPPSSASPVEQRITSESVVSVAAEPVDLPAGGSADSIVRVTIKTGYHTNANPPTFSFLKATELEITRADGISVGLVAYPPGTTKKFPFAEKPLAVYEGKAELKATLKADKSAKLGQRSIPARLRIQACDDQVCYAPGTLELEIPVNIK